MPRLLYYACGGGFGHVARVLALTRQVHRQLACEQWLLTNSPFAPLLGQEFERQDFLHVLQYDQGISPDAACRIVASALEQVAPDALIVDTFPRGLGGEFAQLLPRITIPLKMLIGRHLSPEYVDRYQLQSFVHEQYDGIFTAPEGNPFAALEKAVPTAPWFSRSRHELDTPERVCQMLELPERCVLVVGSGTPVECRSTERLWRELAERWSPSWPPLCCALPESTAECDGHPRVWRKFPLLEWLPAVRLLIGAAGYHLVHEARGVGLPALLRPVPRKYDDQYWRASTFRQFTTIHDLLPLIERHLTYNRLPTSSIADYENGAESAARWLADQMTVRGGQ